jgi:hypothetical protein
MRYVDINIVIAKIPAKVMTALKNKHQVLVNGDDPIKQTTIDNGNTTWRDTKKSLENASNRKCWYTESKNPGCLNDVEHFRPKGKKINGIGVVHHWYWFLAFDPENYRLSCQFSNRINKNPESGLTGGKGNQFPLMGGQAHSTTKAGIALENPVLLDPCSITDCDLLEFQPDGRPVVSSKHRNNQDASYRVEQSKLLLNLDFPTFNEDRESLYNDIKRLVERGERYGAENPAIEDVKQDLHKLMDADSPYSKAAECYIRCFRDHEWVEEIILGS